MGDVTVCKKCRYFVQLETGSVREHVWYNHLCKATPLPMKVDPYDGKTKPYCHNDLGGEYFTENPFKYCRDVNDGQCPQFQALGPDWISRLEDRLARGGNEVTCWLYGKED